ncbi:MAG: hypothetical protein FIB00_04385 [Chloroflexi bacterium]|nr:hypothetical protein [Dehalococcoidia bacterium]NJD64473.1 hypothetical protein [Chloroflexota bacterium]PWB46822.1 MAG: hypothetical protein C3F10_04330 [Dehalococcoidia bacterium]
MTVRIAIEDLPPEARRAIERGDSVEVERDGEIVGRLEPDFTPASGWERFLEIRHEAPQLDHDDFIEDLKLVRSLLNQPAPLGPWAP